MVLKVKLYNYHDLDLVCLYRYGQLDFRQAIRMVLNAYGRQYYFRLSAGPPVLEKAIRNSYTILVPLDEKQDIDALQVIRRISLGYRNNFVKTVLRGYLGLYVPEDFLNSKSEATYFLARSDGVCKDRKAVICPRGPSGHKKRSAEGSTPPTEKAGNRTGNGISSMARKKSERKTPAKSLNQDNTRKVSNNPDILPLSIPQAGLPAGKDKTVPTPEEQAVRLFQESYNMDAGSNEREGEAISPEMEQTSHTAEENSQDEDGDITQMFMEKLI